MSSLAGVNLQVCAHCGKRIVLTKESATSIGITPDDRRPLAMVHSRCYTPPSGKRRGGHRAVRRG